MKRKFLVTILSAAAILAAGALAACSNNGGEHEHVWNGGEITSPASCGSRGLLTYTCTECGDIKSEIIPQLEHAHSDEWLKNDDEHWHAATCRHTGERVGVSPHEWDEGQVISAANCLKTGLIKYTCVCGETKTEKIEKTEHSFAEYSKDDDKHWRVCTVEGCNEIEDEGTHNWNNGEITTPATCLAEGVKTFTCTDCNHTKTETVAVIDHSYGEEWSADESGHFHACTTVGCTSEVDQAVHTYGEWVVGDLMYKPCVVCGYHYLADTLIDIKPAVIMIGGGETAALALLTRSTGYYTVACNLTANAVFSCRYWDREGNTREKTVTLSPEEDSFTLKLEGRGTCYITIVSEAAAAVECSVTLTYLGATLPGHTHSYSTEWSKDETWHWHACTGEDCEEESGSGAHDWDGSVCIVCGYENSTVQE